MPFFEDCLGNGSPPTSAFLLILMKLAPGLRVRIDLMRIRIQHFFKSRIWMRTPRRCGPHEVPHPKIQKNLQFEIFFSIKIYLSPGLHKGRPSYRRSLQPSKENIQHFKTWKFFTFFYFCVSFLPSWIRIQQLKLMQIRFRNPGSHSIQYAPEPLILYRSDWTNCSVPWGTFTWSSSKSSSRWDIFRIFLIRKGCKRMQVQHVITVWIRI